MSLPPIEPYIETFFWATSAWKKIPDGWVRRDVYSSILSNQFEVVLERFGSVICGRYPDLAENIFDRLVEANAIQIEENPVSGKYFRVDLSNLSAFQQKYLGSSEIHRQVQTIGNGLFDDVFAVYSSGGLDIADSFAITGAVIPASDRIVTLSDNQITEIENPLDEIIEHIEKSNGDPDHIGFRERMLGQLKAGKELVRAGTFKAYLLYSVLMTALVEVAARHKGTVIEASIDALIAMLIQSVFSGS